MNPALVKIDVAAADLGHSVARIFQLVDGGSVSEAGLLWVFNFSRKSTGRRDLRFWRPELFERFAGKSTECHGLEIHQVIGQILPERRERFHAGQVDQLFQIRPRTRMDFSELTGDMEGGRHFYSRANLAAFLQGRWMGGAK